MSQQSNSFSSQYNFLSSRTTSDALAQSNSSSVTFSSSRRKNPVPNIDAMLKRVHEQQQQMDDEIQNYQPPPKQKKARGSLYDYYKRRNAFMELTNFTESEFMSLWRRYNKSKYFIN